MPPRVPVARKLPVNLRVMLWLLLLSLPVTVLGLSFFWASLEVTGTISSDVAMFGAVAILGAILSGISIIRWRNFERREFDALWGACPNCGYDLRKSNDRCPECGQPFQNVEPKP